MFLTSFAGIVDQDNLSQQFGRRPVDDAVDRTYQRRPSLVMKHYHDAGIWQVGQRRVGFGLAPVKNKGKSRIRLVTLAFV